MNLTTESIPFYYPEKIMKWFLVMYLVGSEEVMVSKESFESLDACGTYFNEVQEDLKKMKNIKEIRCEEGAIGNSSEKKGSTL